MPTPGFHRLHQALQSQVDRQFLAGVSTALLRDGDVVDQFCCGYADIEAREALREDHLFRIFSNTKLVTSCAVLLLVEDGRLKLQDRADQYLPELANRKVLLPDATRIDQIEDARTPITIAHLMTHTAGLSYGMFDPGSVLYKAYRDLNIHHPGLTLAEMMGLVARLPLAFQPGTQWEYSIATDVLGRLVEVVSGQRFSNFLAERIFQPLGMRDTGFHIPAAQQHRLCALYGGKDFMDPNLPGLNRMDGVPFPGAYLKPMPRESGGGGLVSTLPDMVKLVQALMPGNSSLLRPDTVQDMARNQIAPGLFVKFPNMPSNPGRVFGWGSSVLLEPGRLDPAQAAGEFSWGGMAGTTWWIHPQHRIAGVLMTQRYMGFGNPYTFEFRQLAYEALGVSPPAVTPA